MKALDADFVCEYSMNNKTWTQIGNVLDGKHLSTKVSGGYIGAYFGLYSYAKAPAMAKFNWAKYEKL
jgi:alpha-N-arabinofuranosidase